MTPDMPGGLVLAQGQYEYRCNDCVAPLSEVWQVLQVADGYEVSSVRTVPYQSLVISARALIKNGALARCWLEWSTDGGEECLATAIYRRERDRKTGGVYRFRRAGYPSSSIPVAEQHYFPLLRIFSGQLLGALAKAGGHGEVLVPWIQDPSRPDKLFTPDLSARKLEYLGAEQGSDGGARVERYRYRGGQYENGAEYRLCDGLLLAYRWQQGDKLWQVLLKNFSGQWPEEKLWPHARFSAGVKTGVGAER